MMATSQLPQWLQLLQIQQPQHSLQLVLLLVPDLL